MVYLYAFSRFFVFLCSLFRSWHRFDHRHEKEQLLISWVYKNYFERIVTISQIGAWCNKFPFIYFSPSFRYTDECNVLTHFFSLRLHHTIRFCVPLFKRRIILPFPIFDSPPDRHKSRAIELFLFTSVIFALTFKQKVAHKADWVRGALVFITLNFEYRFYSFLRINNHFLAFYYFFL